MYICWMRGSVPWVLKTYNEKQLNSNHNNKTRPIHSPLKLSHLAAISWSSGVVCLPVCIYTQQLINNRRIVLFSCSYSFYSTLLYLFLSLSIISLQVSYESTNELITNTQSDRQTMMTDRRTDGLGSLTHRKIETNDRIGKIYTWVRFLFMRSSVGGFPCAHHHHY